MRRLRRGSKRLSTVAPLQAVADLVTRRPRLVIGIWIVAVIALAVAGRNLDRDAVLKPIFVDGSPSQRAHEIAIREFGSDFAMVVMLRGPQDEVERQGRVLAARLDAMPRVLAISPWVRGMKVGGLNPEPGVAALVVRVEGEEPDATEGLLPPVRRQVNELVRTPVRANIAGAPVVLESLRDANESAAAIGEFVAAPVLLLVLLLVFRSVIAALLPLVIGGAVVGSARGVLSLLQGVIGVDPFATAVIGMMGLALGVDYSLLVVSRFREELEDNDIATAVRRTVAATARSVIPAGSGFILAMFISALLLPGAVARSVSVAVIVATALSMLSAIVVTPALLTTLGHNVNRWSLPRRRGILVAPLSIPRRLAGHPRAVISIMIALLCLSAWAFTLDSKVANVDLLPPDSPGRQQNEDITEALGPGWVAPMEVVVDGRGRPLTTQRRLHALAAFQRHVEGDPGVETMAGLAEVERGARKLSGVKGELADQEKGLDRLASGVSRIRNGAALGTHGLVAAAKGSRGLNSGLGAADAGAGVLANGLQQTSIGSSRLSTGLGRADEGSGQLAQGTAKASNGAGRLADALTRARDGTGELLNSTRLLDNALSSGEERLGELHAPLGSTEAQLASAWQALQRMTSGREDPEYAAALQAIELANLRLTGTDLETGEQADPAYAGVVAGVEGAEGQFGVGQYLTARMDKSGERASTGMKKLAKASRSLDRGLQKLAAGSRQVSDGVNALAKGGAVLSPALRRLSEGAGRLSDGLGLLDTGSGRLAEGLGEGAKKSELLTVALDRVETGLKEGGGDSNLSALQQRSPQLFSSAYFVLASLDGSAPTQRKRLGSLINLDRGGRSARLLVVPRDEPTSRRGLETQDRLEADAEDLARRTGTEVVVGGMGPGARAVNDTFRESAPLMRILLSLVSMIVLIPVLRSLTIPILAGLVNLVTVSATFGVLAILFDGSLLGGPGYVDATVIPASMMVMFGLAIDYEVFVFARIREEYVRTGSTRAAVKGGLDRTAHVVTGAAVIMIAVFLAFSISEFMSIRNFGVAQAVAVFIDAFIVRLIVVPAAMNWLGDRCWWTPRWLERILPGGGPVATTERPAS